MILLRCTYFFCSFQLLDGIVGVFQLSCGMFSWMLIFSVCYTVYTRQPPKCIHKSSIGYFLVFLLFNILYTVFSLLASIHIAVGTLNATMLLTFVVSTLIYTLVTDFYRRTRLQVALIILDIVTVIILCIGVIFLVQPTEIFNGIEYFDRNNNSVYTSLCNGNRFANINATTNSTFSTTGVYQSQSWKGYVYACVCGICNVTCVVLCQHLLRQNTLDNILLWQALICSGVSLLGVAFAHGFVFPNSAICFTLLMVNAFIQALYFYLFYIGMCNISSLDVAILSGFGLPLLFISQFTFLQNSSPTPTNAVAISAAILVFIVVIGKPIAQGILEDKS